MDQCDSSKLKIDYLSQEIENLSQRLEEQININAQYQSLINGRTDMRILLSVMQSEQELLKQQISKILNERNRAVSKVLILEQILLATQQENDFILKEAEQRIKYLQEQIKYYEQSNQNLNLYETDPQNEGYLIKYKQIVNLNEATLRLQQEIEIYKVQLALAHMKMSKLQESKNDLIQLNFTLSNEICRLKLQSSQGVKNVDKYISQLVEVQTKLVQIDDEDSDKECTSPMEDKFNATRINTIFNQHNMPKLDLKRAQQIQAYTLQQMNMKQQKNQDLTLQDELQKWITEYKYLKNNYDASKILFDQLKIQYEDLQRNYNETLSINATLIRANQNYEEKWQNINKQHVFYKQFYLQYKDCVDIFNKTLSNKKLQESVSERKDLLEFSIQVSKIRPAMFVRRSSVNVVGITSVDSTPNSINYKDKIIQMTKDVFQIFKKKHSENESSDEDISQVNQMKREFTVSNNFQSSQKQAKI
ncbi:unnamed protein product (macronuclear) [Paramecium tetraurelia]|uniref:Uncharacterized protein n=1 Tax=Paramecium tetraurelia TaxID=5888 RepID=A0BHD9_PARTE|nr:uncharacterized protein GSPATT00028991001 [Paramecium tetraurelia]CAK57956.1 unnamed protein product [Paramecium tetraurelia]|eukprot:XP_001425354.1 hypothetical protein (macronuclear) [Paramecium tetraurelia strain d4-2]